MAMAQIITVYVYQKSTGSYLYTDKGHPDKVVADLDDGKDFTLTPPPDNTNTWRWVDNHWK